MDKIDVMAEMLDDRVEIIFPCGKIVFDRNVTKIKDFFEVNQQFGFDEIYHLLIGK